MFLRASSTFARSLASQLCVAGAVLALVMQWCIPAVHAVHDALVEAQGQASHALPHPDHSGQHHDHHHHDHGHGEPSQPAAPEHQHDESDCPTCQQFVSLRTFTPPSMPVTLVPMHSMHLVEVHRYDIPFISRTGLTLAIPRGPPGSC